MEVRILGARGSTPVSGPEFLEAGGDTSCVEVRLSSGHLILLDAGTGIRRARCKTATANEVTIFLSHFHWDHIQGLPFLPPLYEADARLHFLSGFAPETMQAALAAQMAPPFFPASWDETASEKLYSQLTSTFKLGPALLTTFPLTHPGGCFGLRIDAVGRSLVYLTDHEPGNDGVDAAVLRAIGGADLLICDAQFTAAEFKVRKGWGHGTPEHAAHFAQTANVGKLLLTHHDPHRSDQELMTLQEIAAKTFPDCLLACSSVHLDL